MSNAFAICVNKRSRRKKFLLSVQSVREIENCSLSPSSTSLPLLPPLSHTALVRLLAGNFHRVDSKLQYDIAAAGAAPWLMQAFCEIAFELSCR